jgi:general secretion pathway protein D
VYIEATIVAVNWSDEMRLAFETQLINAGGAGGLINTNFGLSSFGTSQIWQPKNVATTLGGLTGAIIKSDHVPIIVNALQTKANARVLSKPQLLVDDNETASIASLDTQPTSSISQNNAGNVVTSGPTEEAGTKLQVTPHISSGGYLRLEYQAELSSFTGAQVAIPGGGILSSPKQVNTIESASVTVPTDTTVVVGGLNFDSDRLTRAQIPLIGDIPLIGLLFQDRNSNYRTTTLYVFLTPRILRDPTFQDLRLLTRGPQATAKLAPEFPPLRSEMIDVTSNVLPPRMPAALNQEYPGREQPVAPSTTVTPVEPLAPTQPVQIPLPDASPAVLPANEEEPVREQKGRWEAQPARTPKRGF